RRFSGVHEDAIPLAHDRIAHDLGERRHRANLDSTVALANAPQLRHAAEIDDVAWALDAVLQPVEAVETAGEDPCVAAVPIEQVQRVRGGRGLKELERGHYVSYYGHWALRSNSEFKMQNAKCKRRLLEATG